MSAISIGIQVIMPKTGTSPKDTPPPPANDNVADDAPADSRRAPPPPGMGRLVDKLA
ncbi:MAG: hypothetical protein ABI830_03450 [Pseudolabrys sp.]